MSVELHHVQGALPVGIADLAQAARHEGHRFLDRLMGDWAQPENRFSAPGEALLAAFEDRQSVAIGGISVDPLIPGAFRMRRFYVLPRWRGQGLARQIALSLLNRVKPGSTVTVNAGTASAAGFWERMGFQIADIAGITHILPPPEHPSAHPTPSW